MTRLYDLCLSEHRVCVVRAVLLASIAFFSIPHLAWLGSCNGDAYIGRYIMN